MSAYYTYIVELAQRLGPQTTAPLKILDYGCGAGEVVKIAVGKGLDAYGVDLFYRGGDLRDTARQMGMLGTRILELREDGIIPAPDSSYDVVFANQVFEHIEDFSTPLREIRRVLKPGGLFINIFPSDCSWREGHIGIPFSHWMAPGRLRYWYTFALRTAGFGYFKKGVSRHQWTKRSLDWIDAWTQYKSKADINREFARLFLVENYEADYIIYRVERHPRLKSAAWLIRSNILRPLVAFIGNRFSSHVFVLRKPVARETAVKGA